MKNLKSLMLVLLAFLTCLLASCKDDEDSLPEPTLSISSKVLNLEAFSLDTTLVIGSNYEWTATRPEADTWCKLTQEKEKLHIALEWNTDTVARATRVVVTVEVAGMKKEDYIEIHQKASDPSVVSLSSEKLVFDMDGETKGVTVLANTPDYTWQLTLVDSEGEAVEGEVDWCTVEKDGATLNLTAERNPDFTDRWAQLEVIVGPDNNQGSAFLEVHQLGQRPRINMPDTIVLPADNSPLRVEVSTNLPTWDYSTFGLNAEYVSVTEIEGQDSLILQGIGYGTTVYNGKLIVIAGEGTDEIRKEIIIRKEASPQAAISAEKSNVAFTKDGGTVELTVTSSLPGWSFVPLTDASWLTVAIVDGKLKLTAGDGGADLRQATLTLKVGDALNSATADIKVVQAGTTAFVSLSVNSLALDGSGTEQFVEVFSNTGDWKPTIAEGSGWCHFRMDGDKLYVSADALEAGSRSTTITVGSGETGQDAAVVLTVNQNKPYQVWDYYVLNGERIGIVFEVSDGGMHGKVVSLKAEHSCDMKFSNLGVNDPAPATNESDGRENVKSMKALGNFEHNYPAAAWCDAQNDENGAPGWYLPAIEELKALQLMYFDGERREDYGDDFPTAKATAARERFNRLLTEAGGIPLVLDTEGDDWGYLRNLMSSTEKYIPGTFFGPQVKYFLLTNWGYSIEEDRNSDWGYPEDGGAIRPILTF